MLLFLILTGDIALELLFVYDLNKIFWAYINGGLLLLVTIAVLLAGCSDPGNLRSSQEPQSSFEEIIRIFESDSLCPSCKVVATERS